MAKSKKVVRKFFPAEDYGSGMLRCLSYYHGTPAAPKDDDGVSDRFYDPALRTSAWTKTVDPGYWELIKVWDVPFVLFNDNTRQGWSAYLIQPNLSFPIKEATLMKIINEGLGRIQVDTISIPRAEYVGNGKDRRCRDLGAITGPMHVIHDVKTTVRKQGSNYNLILA